MFAGVSALEAVGEAEDAGVGEMVEDLLAPAFVLDESRLAENRQVPRGGGRGASGGGSEIAGANRAVLQGVDDCHAARVAEGLEDLGLALEESGGGMEFHVREGWWTEQLLLN